MAKRLFKIGGIVFGYALFIVIINAIMIWNISSQQNIVHTKDDYNQLINNIVIKDNTTIKHKETKDYITFKNVKIRNNFKKFEKIENEDDDFYVTYRYKDISNRRLITFEISIYDNLINGSYSSTFIDKYKIKNDIDYLKVLKNYKYNKSSENDDAYNGADSYSLNKNDYYSVIDGDYEGLIKSEDSLMKKTIYLYKNDKTYEFSFNSLGYFSDEDIYDLISTVVIE